MNILKIYGLVYGLLCLTLLSTIFQLYCDGKERKEETGNLKKINYIVCHRFISNNCLGTISILLYTSLEMILKVLSVIS
jgi:hypothetical protein